MLTWVSKFWNLVCLMVIQIDHTKIISSTLETKYRTNSLSRALEQWPRGNVANRGKRNFLPSFRGIDLRRIFLRKKKSLWLLSFFFSVLLSHLLVLLLQGPWYSQTTLISLLSQLGPHPGQANPNGLCLRAADPKGFKANESNQDMDEIRLHVFCFALK